MHRLATNLRSFVRFLPGPLIRRAQGMLFSILGLRWTLATGIEIRILSRTDWFLYNDIFIEGEYDDAIRSSVPERSTIDPITVLDLGANVGFFGLRLFHLLAMAGISPRQVAVIAIEPSTENAKELAVRMRRQPEWERCMSVVQGLVGARKFGSAELFESYNYACNTLLNGLRYPGARRVRAEFVDLDRIIPADGAIDLLKCDIEGSELEFVLTYPDLLRRVKVAVFEVHHEVCDIEQIKACLAKAGLNKERIIADRGNTSIRIYERDSI